MDKGQKNDDESTVFRLNDQDAKIFSETGRSLFSAFYQRIIGMQIAGVDAVPSRSIHVMPISSFI